MPLRRDLRKLMSRSPESLDPLYHLIRVSLEQAVTERPTGQHRHCAPKRATVQLNHQPYQREGGETEKQAVGQERNHV
jgi:hypothetical protein